MLWTRGRLARRRRRDASTNTAGSPRIGTRRADRQRQLDRARHRQPALARVPARDGGHGRAPDQSRATRSGPGARPCTASPRASTPDTLHAVAAQLYAEMLEAGYTTRLRVPLPAPRARRPPVRRSGGDVARADRRRARHRHPPDAAAGAVHDRRLRRPRAGRAPAPLRPRRRRLPAPARHAVRGRRRTACTSAALLPQPARGAGRGDARGARRAAGRRCRCTSTSPSRSARCEDCLAMRGARPVEWLLDQRRRRRALDAGARHPPDDAEVQGIARSGATVAICPTTEANLGDGLFPLRDYLDAGGAWGIGSDSHISVSPVEELRWLEYGQRLVTRASQHRGARRLAQRRRDAAARRGRAAPRARPATRSARWTSAVRRLRRARRPMRRSCAGVTRGRRARSLDLQRQPQPGARRHVAAQVSPTAGIAIAMRANGTGGDARCRRTDAMPALSGRSAPDGAATPGIAG